MSRFNTRIVLSAAIATLVLTTAVAARAADTAVKEGWTELLDGKLTDHWSTEGNWKMADGVVELKPREGEKGWQRYHHWLWLEGDYENFEIEFEYKLEPRGNSGFYFHVGNRKSPVAEGIEVQIYDSAGKGKDAKLTDHDSGGLIPGVPPTANAAKPAGEWNRFHVTCKDKKLVVKLNDQTVQDLDLTKNKKLSTRPDTGVIGFQDHGMPLWLRKIRVRKL